MLSRRNKTILGLYLVSMLFLHVVLAWSVRGLIRQGYPDFKIFYTAGKIIREGHGSQLYDEATQLRVQESFVSASILRTGLLPYNHPPFEALLFVPLSFLPYWAAFVCWDLVNVTILFALFRLLRPRVRLVQGTSILYCVLASLAFFPIFVAFIHGQDILVLVLLLALAWLALQNEHDATAGCWLGLGLFRFHLLLPILVALIWQRRRRAIYGFLTVAAALATVSVFAVGWRAAWNYPADVLRMERSMFQHGTIGPLNMPNLHGLWSDLSPSTGVGVTGELVIAVLSCVLIVFTASKWATARTINFPLGFALCLVTTVITAYHGFAYDLSLLMLAIVAIADHLYTTTPNHRGTLALLGPPLVLSFTPLQMLLWFREDRFGLIVLVLLVWFWAIWRSIDQPVPERVAAL